MGSVGANRGTSAVLTDADRYGANIGETISFGANANGENAKIGIIKGFEDNGNVAIVTSNNRDYRVDTEGKVLKASRTAKTPQEKSETYRGKLQSLKNEMSHDQFNKKYSSLITQAPAGTTFVLYGRTWENDRSQSIYITKVDNKTVNYQFGSSGRGSDRPLKDNKSLGGILQNYYVGSATIVGPKDAYTKSIQFRRK